MLGPLSRMIRPAARGSMPRMASASAHRTYAMEGTKEYYKYFLPFETRWYDNDMFGHMNNISYLLYTDTILCEFLGRHTDSKPKAEVGNINGFVVQNNFTFRKQLGYPKPIVVGLAVQRIGRSSCTYGVSVFGAEHTKDAVHNSAMLEIERGFAVPHEAAGFGQVTHAFVDTGLGKSVPIPDDIRSALELILVDEAKAKQ